MYFTDEQKGGKGQEWGAESKMHPHQLPCQHTLRAHRAPRTAAAAAAAATAAKAAVIAAQEPWRGMSSPGQLTNKPVLVRSAAGCRSGRQLIRQLIRQPIRQAVSQSWCWRAAAASGWAKRVGTSTMCMQQQPTIRAISITTAMISPSKYITCEASGKGGRVQMGNGLGRRQWREEALLGEGA